MRIYANLPTLAVATVLTWNAGQALCSSKPAEPSLPNITLRVVNEGGMDPQPLLRAQKEAVGILRQSGIHLVWLVCEAGRADWSSINPCQRDLGPSEFWLRIVTRRPASTSGDVLGFTELDESLDCRSAGVYYPAAAELARKFQTGVGEILGAAIAHEVGHLILGASAHSPSGVMYAHWGPIQFRLITISELHFTSDQSKELRKRIETRALSTIATRW